jgi:hypothetical protein
MLEFDEELVTRPGPAGGASRSYGRPSMWRTPVRQARRWPVVAVALVALVLVAVASPVTPARADGITWTERTVPVEAWLSVAYGNGTWVAVGTDGAVMTSTDGEEWILLEDAPVRDWRAVSYGNGRFVAVGVTSDASLRTSVAMTSTNGIDWVVGTTPDIAIRWNSVVFGNGRFVALASQQTGNGTRVMTSTDGSIWTLRATPLAGTSNNSDPAWQSVAFGNGTFVAVASGGVNDDRRVMASTNGETWTLRSIPQSSLIEDHRGWRSVAYGNDVFVAVTDRRFDEKPPFGPPYPVDLVLTSPDGITWQFSNAATSADWYSVAFGDGLFVAVSLDGAVMTSPDGIDWTARTAAAAAMWHSVAFGDGLWVAVAVDGALMTSGELVVPTPTTADSGTRVTVTCAPESLVAGVTVTCTITDGDPGIDILWRAAVAAAFAETGVTLDGSGSGTFSFVVPAAALGQELTIELVEWLAPISLGVVGGPVPSSVPSGGGPVPVWSLMMLALAGGLVLRRMPAAGVSG